MVIGMAATKITITLGDDQLREIRALVAAGQAANTSSFVKHAVGIALAAQRDGRRCSMMRFSRQGARSQRRNGTGLIRFWQHLSGPAGGAKAA